MANKGAGACACSDYRIRRQQALDAGGLPCTGATRCKHLHLVQQHFLRQILRELSLVEEGQV